MRNRYGIKTGVRIEELGGKITEKGSTLQKYRNIGVWTLMHIQTNIIMYKHRRMIISDDTKTQIPKEFFFRSTYVLVFICKSTKGVKVNKLNLVSRTIQ